MPYRQLLGVASGVKTGIAARPAWIAILRGAGRKRDVRTHVISGSDKRAGAWEARVMTIIRRPRSQRFYREFDGLGRGIALDADFATGMARTDLYIAIAWSTYTLLDFNIGRFICSRLPGRAGAARRDRFGRAANTSSQSSRAVAGTTEPMHGWAGRPRRA
jgi:hypothetical protein